MQKRSLDRKKSRMKLGRLNFNMIFGHPKKYVEMLICKPDLQDRSLY